MIKRMMSAAILIALPWSASLAADTGSVPQYCEGVQILGDGSWYVKSDFSMGGMSYPTMTVFTPGQMMNGMNIAKMLSENCVR